ncbi:hypothetical protein [Nocardiopsis sp. CC223A]|uniref:hypothetical protein n=1 Tax=Nocardiopsis sp. CC223A TaxID=3044051 RepID=UPI00278BEA2E|nr:hypothetical protein [Nocardiopsis sp. CC223A]
MDFVDRITSLVGPSRVFDKEPIDWGSVEEGVGIKLPKDYKRLLSRYFHFSWGEFFVFTPRGGTRGQSGPLEATADLEAIIRDRPLSEKAIKRINRIVDVDNRPLISVSPPLVFYPSVPGLLRWGMDANGWDYFWAVDGPAESWPVVSRSDRGEWWDEHSMTMSEYLYRLNVEGQICRGCPRPPLGRMVFDEM